MMMGRTTASEGASIELVALENFRSLNGVHHPFISDGFGGKGVRFRRPFFANCSCSMHFILPSRQLAPFPPCMEVRDQMKRSVLFPRCCIRSLEGELVLETVS